MATILAEFTVEVVILLALGTVEIVSSGFIVVKATIVVSGFIFDEVASVVTDLIEVTKFVVGTIMSVEFTVDKVVTILAIGTVGRVVPLFTVFEATMVVSGFIFEEVASVVVVTGLVVEKIMLAEFTVGEIVTILAKGTVGRVVQCFASLIVVSGFIFDEVVTGSVAKVVTGFVVATIMGTVEKGVSGFAVIEATTVVSGFIFDNVVSEL